MITVDRTDCQSYGNYHLEAIGIFSPRGMFEHFPSGEEGIQLVCDWMDKYHPRTFFGSFSYISLGDSEDAYSDSVFLVATDRVNTEWRQNNMDKAKKFKWKKLPIGVSDKKVEKWQLSLPSNLILPEYFLNSLTIDELKENWKKANN